MATGHYARRAETAYNSKGEAYAPLLRGLDNNKDQTYFLHAVDGGKEAAKPLKMVAAAAVIKNPWAGQGYVENLTPEIRRIAP
ncbi:amino acid synthesis family protein, partial [Acinetobacter baumannii]|uniref:amino acid synthesis family protein n=1 Tax=Acinetobacter baumannii TaxID=470 RepID=UPI00398D618E